MPADFWVPGQTFNFLGFTHICGTSQPKGYFTVRRKTIGKRMAAKLKDIREKLRQRMHENIDGTVKWLQTVVRGHFQYHAVPGNEERLKAFLHEVRRGWLRMLRRRSQRTRWTWERFQERLASTGLCGGQRVTAVPTATPTWNGHTLARVTCLKGSLL